jgi:hypothetical protein
MLRNISLTDLQVLVETGCERNDCKLIQGMLLMSLCEEAAKEDSSNKPIYSWSNIISLARNIGLDTEMEVDVGDESLRYEQRLRRRLWWCIYVQESIRSLSNWCPVSLRNPDATIRKICLEDFDLFADRAPDPDINSSPLVTDAVAQIFLVYLFIWRVEICQALTPHPEQNQKDIGATCIKLRSWYERYLQAKKHGRFRKEVAYYLMSHWESTKLLCDIAMLIAERRDQLLKVVDFRDTELEDLGTSEERLDRWILAVVRQIARMRSGHRLQYCEAAATWAVVPLAIVLRNIQMGHIRTTLAHTILTELQDYVVGFSRLRNRFTAAISSFSHLKDTLLPHQEETTRNFIGPTEFSTSNFRKIANDDLEATVPSTRDLPHSIVNDCATSIVSDDDVFSLLELPLTDLENESLQSLWE